MSDPLDALRGPDEPVGPRAAFAAELRRRLELALLPDITPATGRPPAARPTPHRPTTTSETAMPTLTPYLAVADAAAAIDFYTSTLGAREVSRIVGDDGRIGHAELVLPPGGRLYLSDEYPEMGVTAPGTVGGTTVALHAEVDHVDTVFAAAVEAGATALVEPADQPHGARHGTLLDPFGHRWMLSTTIESVDDATLGSRLGEAGMRLETTGERVIRRPGIWAALFYADVDAGIRTLTEVFGFEEEIVVRDEAGRVQHSQFRWPEGGVVQAASAGGDNPPFSDRPTGTESLYVITADPEGVHDRCVEAGLEIVRPLETPDYDPGGSGFTARDAEGNLFSFGTYDGA